MLQKKQFELRNWFDKFIPDKNAEIEREVNRLFNPLFNQLDSFVDQNLENPNFGEAWSKKVNAHFSKEKVTSIQRKILSDMNTYLDEFFREFKFDLNLSVANIEDAKVKRVKKSSTGSIIRWTGAAATTASAIAIANSWNPVGWGLGAVAIGLGIISLFRGNDTKRYNKKKAKIKNRMYNNLEKMKRKNQGALKSWFYDEITHGLKKKITQDLYKQVNLFKDLLHQYSAISKEIEGQIFIENSNLLIRIMELHTKRDLDESGIIGITRLQGIMTKVLVEKPFLINGKENSNFTKLYGEKLIEVENTGDKVKILLDALNVSIDEVENVSYCQSNDLYEVKVRKKFVGKVIGHQGSNIKTTEKLLNVKIKIKKI